MKIRIVALLALLANVSVAQSSVSAKPILAGMIVNGKEMASVDAYQVDNDFFIPFDGVIQRIGIQPQQQAQSWHFSTPLGDGSIPFTSIKTFDGKQYVAVSALKKIGVNTEFNQSAYAIQMTVPWDKTQLGKTEKNQAKQTQIDYYPQRVGLNEISLDGGYTWQKGAGNKHADWHRSLSLGTSGNLLGGVWGNELQWQENSNSSAHSSIEVDNLYWVRSEEQVAKWFKFGMPGGLDSKGNSYNVVNAKGENPRAPQKGLYHFLKLK